MLLQRNNKLIVMDSIVIAVNEPMFAPGPLEHIFGGNNKLTTADWCEATYSIYKIFVGGRARGRS